MTDALILFGATLLVASAPAWILVFYRLIQRICPF